MLSNSPDVSRLNLRAVNVALAVAVLMIACAGLASMPQTIEPNSAPAGENWWPAGGSDGRWWRA